MESFEQKGNEAWHEARLHSIEFISDQYLVLTLTRPDGFNFSAGQYTALRLQDQTGSYERMYSIASAPHLKGALQFCIQSQGDGRGVASLKALEPGDEVSLKSPQGNFRIADSQRPLVFVAGGSGISPIRAFISELTLDPAGSSIQLIHGCREAESIPFHQEFLSLSQRLRNRLGTYFFAEKGQQDHVYPGSVLKGFSMNPELINLDAHYYLCGPNGMVSAVKKTLFENGISEGQVFTERFS